MDLYLGLCVLDRGLSPLIAIVLSNDIKGWSTMSKSGKMSYLSLSR